MMKKYSKIFLQPLKWMQRLCVRSINIPHNPVLDLGIDPNRPITFILRDESACDLFTLESFCKEAGLPSPFESLYVGNQVISRVLWVHPKKSQFHHKDKTQDHITLFKNFLQLHKEQSDLDVQLIPVSLFWGRKPGQESADVITDWMGSHAPQSFRKLLQLLFLGRRCSIQLSKPVSLRYMADKHGTDDRIAHKLSRVARVHFKRLHRAIVGPYLPERRTILATMMRNEAVVKAIQDEGQQKKISVAEAEDKAFKILNEITANYTDNAITSANYILTWLWNKVYQGITVCGTEQVRKLAKDGHSIVYVPCHRSHMDYLLVSYLLYQQGILPPHIAAGINLNFWPAGPIFRKGGAFFLRRSFSGDKFYAAIFRAYLDELFNKGYSVEFFIEGGRSRTGRLLNPKTGMLAMTMQSMLRGIDRPISLVPVYLGYDHVMEVATYRKELAGQKKKKESVWHIFSALKKLKDYGQCYVNFGEPITLHKYLNAQVPDWREDVAQAPDQKPSWLNGCVNQLAIDVMGHINHSASVTSVSLTSLILLATKQTSLERTLLEKQLELSLSILRHVPYNKNTIIPSQTGKEFLQQVIDLHKVDCIEDDFGQVISLNESTSSSMVYYRNNILHLLIVPGLIAYLMEHHKQSSRKQIVQQATEISELLKIELFLKVDDFKIYVENIIDHMIELELLLKDKALTVNSEKRMHVLILAGTASESIQRYAILYHVFKLEPYMDRQSLEQKCATLAERMGTLNGMTAPEFFDKKLYSHLGLKMRLQNDSDFEQHVEGMYDLLYQLLPPMLQETLANARYL